MTIINYGSVESLVLSPTGIQTNSFIPTAGAAYKRGDLLGIDATGLLVHAASEGSQDDWQVVCLEDCTAEQANKHSADTMGIPVYTHGEINLDAVTLNGIKLSADQKLKARAHSAKGTSITLRKPFNGMGVQ